MPDSPPVHQPFSVATYGIMIAVFAAWGAQQVAIKVGNAELAPIFQAALRSIGATLLLTVWFILRGTVPWRTGVRLREGLVLGVLFSLDFAFLFVGLNNTSASRGTILYYTAPIMIAAGTALLGTKERIGYKGAIGIFLAFCGVAIVLRYGADGGIGSLWGDMLSLGAAAAWAGTILYIKGTSLTHVSASAVLYFQLLGSALLLPVLSLAVGEVWSVPTRTETFFALGFQVIVVAFASYLIFFWLLKRHAAAKLSAFSFLAPVFGVIISFVLLEEQITAVFGAGALLVVTGLCLVARDGTRQ